MKQITKIDVTSMGKIMGTMYAIMGFIFGALVTLFSILGSVLSSQGGGRLGIFFGIGAIIFLPIFYGALGFIFGAFSGWLYNLIAKWVGGLKIEIQETSPESEK
jgi:hypothetical protein